MLPHVRYFSTTSDSVRTRREEPAVVYVDHHDLDPSPRRHLVQKAFLNSLPDDLGLNVNPDPFKSFYSLLVFTVTVRNQVISRNAIASRHPFNPVVTGCEG
jgi:hypothetical protein